MRTTPDPYRGFRFPAGVISHAVWLYRCFGPSLREVGTILAERASPPATRASAPGACTSGRECR